MNIKKALIIAPHIDDETLGCGGSIFKLKKMNKLVSCILVTEPSKKNNTAKKIEKKNKQISKVKNFYKFNNYYRLGYEDAELFKASETKLINDFNRILKIEKPDTIFLPFYNDAHSDHRKIFETCQACLKIFRNNFIKNILMMEVVSETDHSVLADAKNQKFNPNIYFDITKFIKKKIKSTRNF